MDWETIISEVGKKFGDAEIAVRFTDNPEYDARRGVSYMDWGIAPFDSRDECESEYHDYPAVYDETVGGWLPALAGLCAFHDYDVESTVEKARSWSGADAYRFVMVGPARLVGECWDGDLVQFKDYLVFENPEF